VNVVFFGTAPFGLPALEAIAAHPRHRLSAIVTGPDKPQGRGRRPQPTAIAQWAQTRQSSLVLKAERLRSESFLEELRDIEAEAYVVVAYRILPETVISIPRFAFNLHASLLPAYRGAAPIQRAIMAGETRTGVTTFLLRNTVDTGEVLLQRATAIGDEETAGALSARLSALGAELVIDTLDGLQAGSLTPRPQDDTASTPAPRITTDDQRIDFHQPARRIADRIRGLSPRPAALAMWRRRTIKILNARPTTGPTASQQPGAVISADPKTGFEVACVDGAVRITMIQPSGKRAQTGAEFVRGYGINPGERIEPYHPPQGASVQDDNDSD
jgi:methionyl-tRNA formyltransferase